MDDFVKIAWYVKGNSFYMYHADSSTWEKLVMSKITVWKKVLKCVSVKEWQWEFAIAELECEETEILNRKEAEAYEF